MFVFLLIFISFQRYKFKGKTILMDISNLIFIFRTKQFCIFDLLDLLPELFNLNLKRLKTNIVTVLNNKI